MSVDLIRVSAISTVYENHQRHGILADTIGRYGSHVNVYSFGVFCTSINIHSLHDFLPWFGFNPNRSLVQAKQLQLQP